MMLEYNAHPESRIDREIKDKILDMFAVETINDPTTPPGIRASIEVVHEAKMFESKLRAFVAPASKESLLNDDPKAVQKVNDIIEYIRLMSTGLDSFMEAWKHE